MVNACMCMGPWQRSTRMPGAGQAHVFSSLMHIPRLISTNDENARLLPVSKQQSQKSSAVRLA
jgi:hypothetical protein